MVQLQVGLLLFYDDLSWQIQLFFFFIIFWDTLVSKHEILITTETLKGCFFQVRSLIRKKYCTF